MSFPTISINLISFKLSKDHGKLLENIVFLELRRIHSDIYYHRDKHECDFIMQDNGHIINAIQVTATLNGNSKREHDELLEALYKYDLDEGLILTDDDDFENTIETKRIKVIPIWKWLLETN